MVSKKRKRGKKQAATKRFVLSVRFPPEKLEVLDAYVEGLKERQPGGNWTRSSAGLRLILRGLEEGE